MTVRKGYLFCLSLVASVALPAHAEMLEPLSEKRLQALLRSDIRISSQHGSPEDFLKSGRYTNFGDRALITGSYSLRRGRLCTHTYYTAFNRCRTILTDKAGRFYMTSGTAEAPVPPPFPITLIRIQSAPKRPPQPR